MIPVINSLDNPALRETHWKNVGTVLGKAVPMVEVKDETGDDEPAIAAAGAKVALKP